MVFLRCIGDWQCMTSLYYWRGQDLRGMIWALTANNRTIEDVGAPNAATCVIIVVPLQVKLLGLEGVTHQVIPAYPQVLKIGIALSILASQHRFRHIALGESGFYPPMMIVHASGTLQMCWELRLIPVTTSTTTCALPWWQGIRCRCTSPLAHLRLPVAAAYASIESSKWSSRVRDETCTSQQRLLVLLLAQDSTTSTGAGTTDLLVLEVVLQDLSNTVTWEAAPSTLLLRPREERSKWRRMRGWGIWESNALLLLLLVGSHHHILKMTVPKNLRWRGHVLTLRLVFLLKDDDCLACLGVSHRDSLFREEPKELIGDHILLAHCTCRAFVVVLMEIFMDDVGVNMKKLLLRLYV